MLMTFGLLTLLTRAFNPTTFVRRAPPASRAAVALCTAARADASSPTLLLFGAGYGGERVARHALDAGYTVYGTTRSERRAAELQRCGVTPLVFRGEQPLPESVLGRLLPSVTHVLSTVPPSRGRDPVLEHHARLISDRMPALRWLGHFSTATVYGNASAAGAWVDETTEPRPQTAGARLRLLIESEWTDLHSSDAPVHIFRPATIYGPHRGPQAAVRAGTARAIEKEGHVASQIHVHDLAASVLASMERPRWEPTLRRGRVTLPPPLTPSPSPPPPPPTR